MAAIEAANYFSRNENFEAPSTRTQRKRRAARPDEAARSFFRSYLIPGLVDERGRPACAGFPDVLALRAHPGAGGQSTLIEARLFELKKQGEKPTPAQERFHAFAARHGITVEIVAGWEQMEELTAKYFEVRRAGLKEADAKAVKVLSAPG